MKGYRWSTGWRAWVPRERDEPQPAQQPLPTGPLEPVTHFGGMKIQPNDELYRKLKADPWR